MSKVVPTAAQFFADEGDTGPEDISQRVRLILVKNDSIIIRLSLNHSVYSCNIYIICE